MGREFSGEPAKYCYRVLSAAASDNAAVAQSRPSCLRSIADNDATNLVANDIECLNLDFS